MAAVDTEAKRAALALLARGMVTIAEAAEHAGVSRQLMHHWVKRAGVDWQRIRRARRARWWRKELRNGPRLVETQKTRSGSSSEPIRGRGRGAIRRSARTSAEQV